MRTEDTVKIFELRADPNSIDAQRTFQDRAIAEYVQKGKLNLPEGLRPIGGGKPCPIWKFYLVLNDDIEYEIKPHNNGKCDIRKLTVERKSKYRFHGDTTSGKS